VLSREADIRVTGVRSRICFSQDSRRRTAPILAEGQRRAERRAGPAQRGVGPRAGVPSSSHARLRFHRHRPVVLRCRGSPFLRARSFGRSRFRARATASSSRRGESQIEPRTLYVQLRVGRRSSLAASHRSLAELAIASNAGMAKSARHRRGAPYHRRAGAVPLGAPRSAADCGVDQGVDAPMASRRRGAERSEHCGYRARISESRPGARLRRALTTSVAC
jgi:hypothetical protein